MLVFYVQLPRERMMADTCANPGERLCSTGSPLSQSLLLQLLYKICHQRDKGSNQSVKYQFQCFYDIFCKEIIETEVVGDKKIMYMKDILEKFVTIAKVID